MFQRKHPTINQSQLRSLQIQFSHESSMSTGVSPTFHTNRQCQLGSLQLLHYYPVSTEVSPTSKLFPAVNWRLSDYSHALPQRLLGASQTVTLFPQGQLRSLQVPLSSPTTTGVAPNFALFLTGKWDLSNFHNTRYSLVSSEWGLSNFNNIPQ